MALTAVLALLVHGATSDSAMNRALKLASGLRGKASLHSTLVTHDCSCPVAVLCCRLSLYAPLPYYYIAPWTTSSARILVFLFSPDGPLHEYHARQ